MRNNQKQIKLIIITLKLNCISQIIITNYISALKNNRKNSNISYYLVIVFLPSYSDATLCISITYFG